MKLRRTKNVQIFGSPCILLNSAYSFIHSLLTPPPGVHGFYTFGCSGVGVNCMDKILPSSAFFGVLKRFDNGNGVLTHSPRNDPRWAVWRRHATQRLESSCLWCCSFIQLASMELDVDQQTRWQPSNVDHRKQQRSFDVFDTSPTDDSSDTDATSGVEQQCCLRIAADLGDNCARWNVSLVTVGWKQFRPLDCILWILSTFNTQWLIAAFLSESRMTLEFRVNVNNDKICK